MNILTLGKFGEHKVAFCIKARKAGCHEVHLGVQLGKIHDGVAHAAAGGGLDALGDVGQFILLGPGLDGIGDIHDHVACTANTFFHIESLS